MMTKEAYIALYEKCAAGQCSLDELRLLESHHDTFKWGDLPWDETKMGQKEEIGSRIYQRLEQEMDSRRAKRNHLPVYRWSRYAAAAILLIGDLIYLGVQQDRKSVV